MFQLDNLYKHPFTSNLSSDLHSTLRLQPKLSIHYHLEVVELHTTWYRMSLCSLRWCRILLPTRSRISLLSWRFLSSLRWCRILLPIRSRISLCSRRFLSTFRWCRIRLPAHSWIMFYTQIFLSMLRCCRILLPIHSRFKVCTQRNLSTHIMRTTNFILHDIEIVLFSMLSFESPCSENIHLTSRRSSSK